MNITRFLLAEPRVAVVLHITPAERNALQLLAIGTADGEIARILGVAESDVEPRLTKLFAAIGAANQTEAIAIALKRGLVSAGDAGNVLERRQCRVRASGFID
jgi:LuxR family quorum sensing-dependent transcriptional regulator